MLLSVTVGCFRCAVECEQPGAACPVQLREVPAWEQGCAMCQLPWLVHSVMREGSLSKLSQDPLTTISSCSAQEHSSAFPYSPNSTQWFQGTELRLCSVWPRKAKSSTESLSSLFTICSGLEPKAAGLVLENPNRFPLHCVYLKRNKDV